MKPIVAMPFRSQAALVCDEARQMLIDAGFELRCNETGKSLPREEQKAMIADAFAVIAGTEKYDAEMLEGADQLKAVIRFSVGTDNFDLNTMKEKGIAVGVIANHNSVAEFALTLMLNVIKNMPRFDAAVREGKWARFPIRELSKKTVGIVGFGRIGSRLAELLSGFNVNLMAYDPYLDAETIKARGASPATLEELLRSSDIVSLHLPSTPDTYHLINSDTIAMMKDGAYLVKTARGALVDEKALHAALTEGKLAGAALDVYEVEPITADNPLFALDNTALAPHAAALSYETNYNGGITCAQSIIQVYNGGTPVYHLK